MISQCVSSKGDAFIILHLIILVLKSDNANGLFGIYGPCTMQTPSQESSMWSCPVQRQRGDAGEVTLTWEVRGPLTSTSGLATSDFVNATGELVFQSGQRENVGCTKLCISVSSFF